MPSRRHANLPTRKVNWPTAYWIRQTTTVENSAIWLRCRRLDPPPKEAHDYTPNSVPTGKLEKTDIDTVANRKCSRWPGNIGRVTDYVGGFEGDIRYRRSVGAYEKVNKPNGDNVRTVGAGGPCTEMGLTGRYPLSIEHPSFSPDGRTFTWYVATRLHLPRLPS